MKVWAAQFLFESNTFNAHEAEIDVFRNGGVWLTAEKEVRAWCGRGDSQLAGSMAVLETAGCVVHPMLVALCGSPGGRLSAACFHEIRQALRIATAPAASTDAILLHLHGAACAHGEDDVEGSLLELVRTEMGFRGRLVISLDLHANVTRRMLVHADAVTAYRTMPHIDLRETGERAARLLLDRRRTVRALAKIAALIPPTATHHASGGFAQILEQAREAERKEGILDVSLFPVQPWLDVEELGTAVVVTGVEGGVAAETAATLAETWYAQRREWAFAPMSWDQIRATLLTQRSAPWILVDAADATTGGADGGSAEAVVQLWAIRHELPGEVLLWVVDPAACAAASRGDCRIEVGRQRWPVESRVLFEGEGRYVARGAAYTGQSFSMGQAVVIASGQLRIVVSTFGALAADPAFYECVGLHPDRSLAVLAKSLMGWRAGYGAPAERGLLFSGPGVTTLDFGQLPFTSVRRELFPLCAEPAQPVSVWQSN